MKLSDLTSARKQEKELARAVGNHLAHMIWLYAKELWDEGKVKAHKSFDDFWAQYSRGGWKKDFWTEKFTGMVDDALEKSLTKEDCLALAHQVEVVRAQLLEELR